MKILSREAAALGLKDRFSMMDSDDCFAIVQDVSATTDKAAISRMKNHMSLWKNGLISPEQALQDAQDEVEAQAARVYRNYLSTLSSYQAVDFDDLIRLPVELFQRDEAARDRWQRKLRYLLIDEYQDTNTCPFSYTPLTLATNRKVLI